MQEKWFTQILIQPLQSFQNGNFRLTEERGRSGKTELSLISLRHLQQVNLLFHKAEVLRGHYRIQFTFLGNQKISCNRDVKQKVVTILERSRMD